MKKNLYLKIFSILSFPASLSYVLIASAVSKQVMPLAECSVTSITITPINADINSGGTQQFNAIGTLPNGLTQDITSSVVWNSSNAGVAKISASGLATAVLPGLPALITADLPASCNHSLNSNSAALTVLPQFAYVVNANRFNMGTSSVSVCKINPENGLFVPPCVNSGGIFTNPSSVTINTFGGQTFAYVSDGADVGRTVWQCRIDPTTGLFGSSCVDATHGVFEFNAPAGITFYTAGNGNSYAYVTDPTIYIPPRNSLSKCLVNSMTGAFDYCGDAGAGRIFQGSAGLKFNMIEGQPFLYIAVGNNTSSEIAKCPIDYNGNIADYCTTLTTSTEATGSINIDFFKTVENRTYAYVSQYHKHPLSIISRCEMDAQGSFTPENCTDATAGVRFTSAQSNIFIGIGNKTFVYVNDGPNYINEGNRIWQCELDSSSLNLINCQDSGVGAAFNFPTLNSAFF